MTTAYRQLFSTTPVTVTAALRGQFGIFTSVCTLGFSMGSAVLLDAYTEFNPAPACMIVGGAFLSAREGAVHAWGIPGLMAHALPDRPNGNWHIWRSMDFLRKLPFLHPDKDRL